MSLYILNDEQFLADFVSEVHSIIDASVEIKFVEDCSVVFVADGFDMAGYSYSNTFKVSFLDLMGFVYSKMN